MSRPSYRILGNAIAGREVAGNEIGIVRRGCDCDSEGMELLKKAEIGTDISDIFLAPVQRKVVVFDLENLFRGLSQTCEERRRRAHARPRR